MSESHMSMSFSESQEHSQDEQEQTYYVKLVLNDEVGEEWDNRDRVEQLRREERVKQCYIEDKLEEKYFKEKQRVLILRERSNKEVTNVLGVVLERLDKKEVDIRIVVPENYVSVIIGKQGRQIKRIKEETRVDMVIGQPDQLRYHREIKLKGKVQQIVRGVREINEIMAIKHKEDQQNQIKINKLSDKYNEVETKVRLPINEEITQKINYKLIRKMEAKRKVKVILYEDSYRKVRCLGRNENVVELKGQLKEIKEILEYMFKKLCKSKQIKQEIQNKRVKMLIPNSYVTKMIGSKGSMIREIAQLSGGASIRIQSTKDSEKSQKECMIVINGSITNKILAIQNLAHQLEHLKQSPRKDSLELFHKDNQANRHNSFNASDTSSSNTSNTSNSIRSRSRTQSSHNSYRRHSLTHRNNNKISTKPHREPSVDSYDNRLQNDPQGITIVCPMKVNVQNISVDLPSLNINNNNKNLKLNDKEYQFIQLGGNVQDNVEIFRRIQIEFQNS